MDLIPAKLNSTVFGQVVESLEEIKDPSCSFFFIVVFNIFRFTT